MYPLLSKLPKAPASLCTELRTILLAVGHVAAGDATATVAAFQHVDASWHKKGYELAILQSAPLVGIPRTLHAAAVLHDAGIRGWDDADHSGAADCAEKEEAGLAGLRRRGGETFAKVYGRQTTRVRMRLRGYHPRLEEWILGGVYGWTLSRDPHGVSLRERELAAVAALSVDTCAAVQLGSHVRGALRVGAGADEVLSVVRQARVVGGEAAGDSAMRVWQAYKRTRGADADAEGG